MRRNKFGWAVVLAMFAFATPAMAVDHYWGVSDADGDWKTVGNWEDTGGAALATVPADGDNVRFKTGTGTNSTIDINGALTDLPASTMLPQDNNTVNIWIYDSATLTPNASPPANNTDFTIIGVHATIEDAAAAAQPITFGTIDFFKKGEVRFYAPLNATLHKGPENGSSWYYGPVTFGTDDVPRNNGWTSNMRFYNAYTATTKNTGTQTSSLNEFYGVTDIGTFNHVNGVVKMMPSATGTIGTLNLSGGSFDGKAVAVTNLAWTGGTLIASIDGAIPDPTTVPSLGELLVTATQSSWPTVDVGSWGTLRGDMRNATYGPGNKVTFQDNAILAVTLTDPAGPEPSELDLGLISGVKDALIWKGITTTGVHTVGDDGNSVYKGAVVAPYTPDYYSSSQTYASPAGAGDLLVAMMHNKTGTNSRYAGAKFDSPDTGVAQIDMYGTSQITLRQELKGTTTEFHFRNQGSIARDIVNFDLTAVTAAQTVHTYDGGVVISTGAAPDVLGRLELHGESMLNLPTAQIEPVATTRIVLNDNTGLSVNTGEEDTLELMTPGVDLIVNNPRPTVYLEQRNGGYDFSGAVSGTPNPVMTQILLTADLSVNSNNNNLFELNEDLILGDGRYLINWTNSHKGITVQDTAGAAGVIKAGPGASSIGLAMMTTHAGTLKIAVPVDAGGGKVLFGSTTALTALDQGKNRVTAVPVGSVDLNTGASFVNTSEVSVESGTLKANVDFTFGAGIDLALNGGNFNVNNKVVTVNGTLKGSGTWSNGTINVAGTGTVAPGNGVGTLAGSGGLSVEDNATFEWEISANPKDGDVQNGVAGTDWDLLFSTALIDFDVDDSDDGIINIALMDAGMTANVLGTQEFAVAARDNGDIDTPGDWNFIAGDGWNVDAATLVYVNDYIDVDVDGDMDDCLVLSGVTFSPAAPMAWLGGAGTWATAAKWDSGEVPASSSQVAVGIAESNVTVDAPAVAASLDVTDGTVDVQSTLDVGGAVTVAGPGTLVVDGTLTAASATVAGTLAGSGTINVDPIDVTGTVAPGGNGIGTLTLGVGEMGLDSAAAFNAQVSLAVVDPGQQIAADRIVVSADGLLMLGGTLAVSGLGDRASADSWTAAGATVVVNNLQGDIGQGGATGEGYAFAAVTPEPNPAAPPHLGQGAFLRGVNYVKPSPIEFPNIISAVELDLFVALGGDADGDRKVWLSDWAALRANFGNTGTGKT
ncbi:MAG: hypothetical protein HQ567_16090, partial [Candidatus Nealsonbacteria bacterium]|nr:hypothetical protein [Candidatus Nealsonbacteria bacterium]